MSGRSSYLLEHALVDGVVQDDVLVVVEGGTITGIDHSVHRMGPLGAPDGTTRRIGGLVLPGMANCHSHAFHRALRGHTQAERGSFWTWREQMYQLAEDLTPDSYFALARQVYAEMAAAGITAVGEFHYLHHQPDGRPYDDPNEMGRALLAAADDAGLRIRLLDTCYVAAGLERDGAARAPEGVQRRFSDGDATRWAERVEAFGDDRVGAAIHSVRAVPREQLATVAAWAAGRPLHVHLSEQVAENDDCLDAHGLTPTQLLAEEGVLGPMTSVVHATHLTSTDIDLLGQAGCFACFCPTTERDLADGIGPSRALAAAGARLTLGSDSHAVIDPFEELRAVEMHERLATQQRGHWSAAELLEAGTAVGHESLGFADAGRIAPGQRAELVVVDLDTWRTRGAGASAETAVFAATAADVTEVLHG
ncbi:formimidoylglutamate deiminase [Nocardioides terrisoli]|uniref:formimidoylglutamate deiminase n=1 Tax=Nocardioides terrisoli TaxID=3388267 RepID=UPI00287B82D4|nr:formimidoylglutamate deiminase [Nocardioides marmorisolisilvae]